MSSACSVQSRKVDLTQCYIDSTTTEPFGLVIDTGFSALNILKIDVSSLKYMR